MPAAALGEMDLTRPRCRRAVRARTVTAMDKDDDAELMRRYASGDMRAFEELYRRHRTALYNYLARHTRDREAAHDLFQEVWTRVIATRARYEPRAKFRTFLFHIAHNCFIDHCRRAAARVDRISTDRDGDGALGELSAPRGERPEERAQHAETLARYRAALESLPSEQRDAFLLYEESNLSLADIAGITGVGAETVKSRIRYALAKLRRALAPHGEVAADVAGAAEEPSL